MGHDEFIEAAGRALLDRAYRSVRRFDFACPTENGSFGAVTRQGISK
jgi:hypothetical protein